MRVAYLVHPATLLLGVCCVWSVAWGVYETYVVVTVGIPTPTATVGAMSLFAVGVWPCCIRPAARRAAHTAAASLLAIPLAGMFMGTLLHDLSIALPWLEHDRWCCPRSDRLLTSATAPYFLFLPLLAWACLLWFFLARAKRAELLPGRV